MRKRFKVLSSALLASSLLLSGCSSKKVEPGSKPGYDEGEEYLSMWVHVIEDTDEGRAYRQSVNEFNEKYDGQYFADVEFVPRNDSGGGYSDKINASVMSGDLPDVLTVDGPNVAAYAANGIIQPLSELSEEETSIYLPSILDQGTYDGKLYALGAMESSVGMYYNKDILEKAGVEVPDGDHPWTFSEFLDVLEKVKPITDELNGYPLAMSFPVGETTIYYYAPFFWSNGVTSSMKQVWKQKDTSTAKPTKKRLNTSRLWLIKDICPVSKFQICLKVDAQPSNLMGPGKSTRSITTIRTSNWGSPLILLAMTGMVNDTRQLDPGPMPQAVPPKTWKEQPSLFNT